MRALRDFIDHERGNWLSVGVVGQEYEVQHHCMNPRKEGDRWKMRHRIHCLDREQALRLFAEERERLENTPTTPTGE